MIVTQVVELSKSRSKVYIDQELAFVLYKGELRLYHIKEGKEIAETDYKLLMEEVLPKRAKLRCMNLLKSREYTRTQLKDKLRQGYYPEAIMEEALDYVESYHYIDDERYVYSFITYNNEKKSRRRIENDLLSKGVSKEIINKAWQEWESEGNAQDEYEQIKDILAKKKFDTESATSKEYQKIYAHLARKGFSTESIRKVLRNREDD